MTNASNSIAVISSKNFKWTVHIEFKESFSNKNQAIDYASRHDYNLIVRYDSPAGPRFDVMRDPDMDSTSRLDCELVETVTVLVESDSPGWSRLVLSNVFGLAKRLTAAANNSRRENASATVHSHALATK